MLTTADSSTIIAADPERDQLYFVDAQGLRLLHTRALAADGQPALHAAATDVAAAERGKDLFESVETGCTQCHRGPQLTNNRTENVGAGADLQVPSLRGVRFRTPLMHDRCAATVSDRFTSVVCGGGTIVARRVS